ncbi:MAG: EF-P lysine aminoacylase EpmA [Rhodospirillaceae bacterium]|nr:EF-P lysine aminoacylase EpmA [Rhodospirillaceae bacterium]
MPADPPWWHPESLSRRRPALDARRAATKAVRAYFQAEGFIEVETPILQVSGGIERHIRPLRTTLHEPFAAGGRHLNLQTSPEFAMKKLLAGGLGKIWQQARVFRDGERGPLHHPEFTMLEWYRVGTDYAAMMTDCAALAAKTARVAQRTLEHDGLLWWQGVACDAALAPERLSVQEAFGRHAGIDLLATIGDTPDGDPDPAALIAAATGIGVRAQAHDRWEDVFFRVMLDRIEPHLGHGRLTMLCDYPAPLAALARRKPGNARIAERFEMYACGVELANGYSELTDAAEQRARFAQDRALHERLYGAAPPLDEDFLRALEAGVPACSGCALGFDRLVMLAAHAQRIDDVLWAPVDDGGAS